jgi:crotonobetainyl-CoA:carnitine CoA-transferase CaiB-like acyl-CoA transferase
MVIDNPASSKTRPKEIGIVPKFSLTPGQIKRPSPVPGQDTDQVLTEIGVPSSEILKLRSEAIIK